MDERVKLVAQVNGGHEIRIKAADLEDIGPDGLTQELRARGIEPSNLGEPLFMQHRNTWVIPVRRSE